MARSKSKQPTDRELKLLQALWELEPARLSEIAAKINETESIALTTVATMMKLMEDKRMVKRTSRGGQTLWSATVGHEETKTGYLRNLAQSLFGGSSKLLVSHLLEQEEFTREEREEIAKLLNKQKTRKAGNN